MYRNHLTIGILTCDNDVDKVASCVARVQERVHIPYEVIVWDNTETKDLPPLEGVKVLSAGTWKENVRQFDARKGIVQKAAGDYVWYIDPDDDFMAVDDTFIPPCGQVDAVVFKYKRDMSVTGAPLNDKLVEVTHEGFLEKGIMCGGLWNKWFRADALREAYALRTFPAQISIAEDDLIELLFCRTKRNVYCSAKVLYKYMEHASTAGHKVIASGDEMRRYVFGLRSVIATVQSVYTAKEQTEALRTSGYDWVVGKVGRKLGQALQAWRDKAAELVAPVVDEIGYSATLHLVRSYRMSMPLGRMKAWLLSEWAATRLLRKQPVTLQLNCGCDRRCAYCGQAERRDRAELPDDELYSNFDKALTKLEGMCPQGLSVSLLGGEPTLMNDTLVRRIIKRLDKYDHFNLLTNGCNKQSAWYASAKCWTMTHITDWRKTGRAKPSGERDSVKIVVTHQDIAYLSDFLDKNGTYMLDVSPCTCTGTVMDCTADDMARISDIREAHGMGRLPMLSGDALVGSSEGAPARCDHTTTEWAVDCSIKGGALISRCCLCFQSAVPVDEFTADTPLDCSKCTGQVMPPDVLY